MTLASQSGSQLIASPCRLDDNPHRMGRVYFNLRSRTVSDKPYLVVQESNGQTYKFAVAMKYT
jgi:hypothetical protein